MSSLLLDTHVLVWWVSEPDRVSKRAAERIEAASTLAVCAITWFEISWLAGRGRIALPLPVRTWVSALAERVETVPITPAVAATAAALPDSFPHDPADRLIYATAIERGLRLVTKDGRMRKFRYRRPVTVW